MLYAALYFGQRTFIVTNDEFRDHSHVLAQELEARVKLWQRQRQITFRRPFTGKFHFNVSCALLIYCICLLTAYAAPLFVGSQTLQEAMREWVKIYSTVNALMYILVDPEFIPGMLLSVPVK